MSEHVTNAVDLLDLLVDGGWFQLVFLDWFLHCYSFY